MIDVRDYGATPDDDSDDTEALRDAFAAAPASGAIVGFEPGTYRIEGTDPVYYVDGDVELKQPIFELEGYTDLEIRGNGATLSARDFAPTFHLMEVDGLTVRDLTIDWDRDLPHTAGTVVADTPAHVDVEVNDPYTPRDELYAVSFLEYDRENERYDPPLYLQRGEGKQCMRVSEAILRCEKVEDSGASFTAGDGVVVRHTSAAGTAMKLYDCEDVTVRGVNVHSAPGMAINVHGGKNVTVEDTHVVPAPEAGRWQSAARDGFHVSNVRGHVRLRGVTVEKTGDDAFNFKGRRYEVDDVPDKTTLVIERPALDGWFEYVPFSEGDQVEVGVNPQPFVPEFTGRLAGFEKSSQDAGPGVVHATYKLHFEEALPDAVLQAYTVSVFNATQTPEEVVLTNSRAAKLRGGARFMLDHTEITGCTFEETTGNPVLLQVNRVEGEPANHFAVRDTEFVHASYNERTGGGLITTFGGSYGATPPPGTWSDLTVENNSFEDIRDGFAAIELSSASDVTIEENDFSGISGTDPVNLGVANDCETIHIDGETACNYYD